MVPLDDTIAAISSAPGPSHTGIIRLSGPEAFALVAPFVTVPETGHVETVAGWHRLAGRLRLDGHIDCPCDFYFFRAPRSYTTEPMVELHLPGSPALLQWTLGQLLRSGARLARPGEFTCRAFLNHRIDLTEAQAVAAMIQAQSDTQLHAAERLLEGSLRVRCDRIRQALLHTLALVEAGIDFSQEDIVFITPRQTRLQLQATAADLAALIQASVSWQQLDTLPRVVLAGPANAGKSSLVNRLTGVDRSIVSAIAGTTRDILTIALSLEQGECLLLDTAGLGPVDDPLAAAAQHLTGAAMQGADLILWVTDVSDPESRFLQPDTGGAAAPPALRIMNKADRLADPAALRLPPPWPGCLKTILCSALCDPDLNALRGAIARALAGLRHEPARAAEIALTVQQRHQLQSAHDTLDQALTLAEKPVPPAELLALELRTALEHLAVISGEVTTGDLLDRIFGQFCIGK